MAYQSAQLAQSMGISQERMLEVLAAVYEATTDEPETLPEALKYISELTEQGVITVNEAVFLSFDYGHFYGKQ